MDRLLVVCVVSDTSVTTCSAPVSIEIEHMLDLPLEEERCNPFRTL